MSKLKVTKGPRQAHATKGPEAQSRRGPLDENRRKAHATKGPESPFPKKSGEAQKSKFHRGGLVNCPIDYPSGRRRFFSTPGEFVVTDQLMECIKTLNGEGEQFRNRQHGAPTVNVNIQVGLRDGTDKDS